MDKIFSYIKRSLFTHILIVLSGCTLTLAILGWSEALSSETPIVLTADTNEAMFIFGQTIRAFVFSDAYAAYDAPWFNWKIEWAGLFGAVVAISAIIRAFLKLFVSPLERWRATRRKKHGVVLGDRSIAESIAVELFYTTPKVTYHTNKDDFVLPKVLDVPRSVDLTSRLMTKSMSDAERIIIAERSDQETAETALDVSDRFPDTLVFAVMDDPWTANSLRELSKSKENQLIAVSETRARARSLILRVPPFLLASKQGHDRIHAVFCGFDDLTISLIEEILLTSLLPTQKLPRFTILTSKAYEARRSFEARHPNLTVETKRSDFGQVDIEFIECCEIGVDGDAAASLKSISDPVTVVFITPPATIDAFACALAAQKSAGQKDLFDVPIFVSSHKVNGLPVAMWKEDYAPREMFGFGNWHDISMTLGILDKYPDSLAKAYHEAYRRAVWNDDSHDGRWDVLPEVFRMSNRHAVLHLPAKLAALGFDITPYLLQDDCLSPNTAPKVQPDALIVPESMLETMSHLEHGRWMMERWVTGWRFADIEKKDPDRLLHPDLRPYEQLSDFSRSKDRQFISWLDDWIERDAENGVSRGG